MLIRITSVDGNITVTGSGSWGVYVDGTIKTTGSGNINVTGASNNTGIVIAAANGIQTTGTGNITISTDAVNLGQANDINSAANLTILPYTNGATMGVGTNASGAVNWSYRYLGYITYANTLTFGNTSAGALDINTASTIANKNLTFISNATIYLDKSGDTSPTALTDSGSSNTTLTMQAGTDIVTAGAITDSGTGKLNVVMDADYALGGGAINIGGNITTLSGNITMGGGNGAISAGSGYAVGDAYQAAGILTSAAISAGLVATSSSTAAVIPAASIPRVPTASISTPARSRPTAAAISPSPAPAEARAMGQVIWVFITMTARCRWQTVT